MYKHILIPTDGSERSSEAIHAGIALAKSLGARITGMCAVPQVPPAIVSEYGPQLDLLPAFMEAQEATARARLRAIDEAAKAAGVECETVQVADDLPYDAIIKTAEKRGCDLIFMASHGRRGLGALVLGSETHKVLTHCKIPVLVDR